MGLGGISLWQLGIILLIVVVIFGTKRLKDIGKDLGGAVKGFRQSMSDADREPPAETRQLNEPDAEFPDVEAAKRESERHSKL